MSVASEQFRRANRNARNSKTRGSPRHKTTRDCPRVTLRLSVEDHEKLKSLADGMALSTYIRAKALGDALPRRKRRSTASVEDKAALAQILGLLGQSRIANNLNQLAYHANDERPDIGETERAQINEGYVCVMEIRSLLMQALGTRP